MSIPASLSPVDILANSTPRTLLVSHYHDFVFDNKGPVPCAGGIAAVEGVGMAESRNRFQYRLVEKTGEAVAVEGVEMAKLQSRFQHCLLDKTGQVAVVEGVVVEKGRRVHFQSRLVEDTGENVRGLVASLAASRP